MGEKDTVNRRADCEYQGLDRDQLITHQNLLSAYCVPKQEGRAVREGDSSPGEGRDWSRSGVSPCGGFHTPGILLGSCSWFKARLCVSNQLPGVLQCCCPTEHGACWGFGDMPVHQLSSRERPMRESAGRARCQRPIACRSQGSPEKQNQWGTERESGDVTASAHALSRADKSGLCQARQRAGDLGKS